MSFSTTSQLSLQQALTLKRNRSSGTLSIGIGLLLFAYLLSSYGWRQASLFLVGLAAGVILYHAAFGFTAAWREVVTTGRGAGLRAQMMMLAVTVLIVVLLIIVVVLININIKTNGINIFFFFNTNKYFLSGW